MLPCGAGEGEDLMNINFTSAQQNCRGGGKGGGGKGGGGGGGPMGGAMQGGGMQGGMNNMQGGKGGMGKGGGKGGSGQPGRSIYCGNLPRDITPGTLASVSLGFGLLESLRFMPQQVISNPNPNPNPNPRSCHSR